MLYFMAVQHDGSPQPTDDELQVMFDRVGRVNDEMQSAGIWVFAGGLGPPDDSTVVRVTDGRTTITDGPFAETKEQLGGFWVIRVPDLDAALAWAGKCTEACGAPVEVRPFDEASQD
ncbi:YciI family protein [Pseudonocardia endophytica]|uniref:YCII-related domain-containing protein n=1 Tax=Pseudonocardia endophytica TaxID=401976 RepID=A0A4R1HL48_PSEEN|nr:YciI family protein [Pseudonocardia endophytica]TCK21811.1 hypothetical protein EV378_5802 [Pseudonocardia endophytica]